MVRVRRAQPPRTRERVPPCFSSTIMTFMRLVWLWCPLPRCKAYHPALRYCEAAPLLTKKTLGGKYGPHIGDGRIALVVEGRNLPGILVDEQLAQEGVVEGVPRLVAAELA